MPFAPRITLGPGDSLPAFQDVLFETIGVGSAAFLRAVDLTGRTVTLRFQQRGATTDPVTIPVTNAQASITYNRGAIEVDWSALDGTPVPGDYDYRIITVDGAGNQESFPRDGFWLMRVAADFRAGSGSPVVTGVKIGAWFTTVSLAALAATDVSRFAPGQAFAVVAADPNPNFVNSRWRLYATSGVSGDGSTGVLNSTDSTLQWFLF